MRIILFAVLLSAAVAAPCLAVVTIGLVDNGDATADIVYQVTGEPNKVAAFALDVTVDSGAIITDVNNFHRGVSIAGSSGYGIFPANFDRYITVNTNGEVEDWSPAGYTPVAEAGDKGTLGGIGTSGITLELGGLWKGDANAPADSGVLCTITVDRSCMATLAGNVIRGGVLLEGGGAPTSVSTAGDRYISGGPGCEVRPEDCNDWIEVGKPDCWMLVTQCLGDVDGKKEGSDKIGYWRVHFRDLNTLLTGWNVKEPAEAPTPSGPGITTVSYTDSQGEIPAVCADFDRRKEGGAKTGYFRVHFNDLNILIENWSVQEPPQGPGLPLNACGGLIDVEP